MDGRRLKRLGPSPILGSLGPSHQWRHKSRLSLREPSCAHGVVGTPHGEVRNIEHVEDVFEKMVRINIDCGFSTKDVYSLTKLWYTIYILFKVYK